MAAAESTQSNPHAGTPFHANMAKVHAIVVPFVHVIGGIASKNLAHPIIRARVRKCLSAMDGDKNTPKEMSVVMASTGHGFNAYLNQAWMLE